MTVLAVCAPEKPNWAIGALVIATALLVYVLPIGAAFKTAPRGTRRWLALVYLVGIGISVLFGFVLPGGLSGDADYLGLFLGGVALGAGCGVVAGFLKPRAGLWRHALVGTLGGGTFMAGVAALLVFFVYTTSLCFD